MIRGHPVFVLCVLALAMVLCATSQVSAMMNQSQNTSSPVMLATADNNGGGSNIVNSDTAAISISNSSTSLSIANDTRANENLSVMKGAESVNPYDAECSYVNVGNTMSSLSSLGILPAEAITLAHMPTAETAFTANAPEESKAIANDRTVMVSSPAITLSFASTVVEQDRLQ